MANSITGGVNSLFKFPYGQSKLIQWDLIKTDDDYVKMREFIEPYFENLPLRWGTRDEEIVEDILRNDFVGQTAIKGDILCQMVERKAEIKMVIGKINKAYFPERSSSSEGVIWNDVVEYYTQLPYNDEELYSLFSGKIMITINSPFSFENGGPFGTTYIQEFPEEVSEVYHLAIYDVVKKRLGQSPAYELRYPESTETEADIANT